MMTDDAAQRIRTDNGKVGALADADPIVVDADLFNSWDRTITAIRTFAIPTNSITGAPRNGAKLTFSITQGGAGLFVPVFTGGAGGYAFANAASPDGITLAQHNALAVVTPAASMYQVAFQYHAGIDRYVCNGLGGYWL